MSRETKWRLTFARNIACVMTVFGDDVCCAACIGVPSGPFLTRLHARSIRTRLDLKRRRARRAQCLRGSLTELQSKTSHSPLQRCWCFQMDRRARKVVQTVPKAKAFPSFHGGWERQERDCGETIRGNEQGPSSTARCDGHSTQPTRLHHEGATVTKVFLVDDHPLFRAGIRQSLAPYMEFCIVGEAGNARDAFVAIETHRPDIVVMDVALPGMDGVIATREIRRRTPRTRVLIFSVHDQIGDVLDALDAGAAGYALKTE